MRAIYGFLVNLGLHHGKGTDSENVRMWISDGLSVVNLIKHFTIIIYDSRVD